MDQPTVFAKWDGIDGESADSKHEKWIDILSVDWGAHRPGGRGRGTAVCEDVTLTIEYEKASPKLMEKLLKGEIIKKLEIEVTSTYDGARATFLKYELKNVLISSFQTSASGGAGDRPTVVVGNNFEEIKVTYTEYGDDGKKGGNVETTWKVGKGEK